MSRLAWHFAPANGCLAYSGEPIPADGVTLKLDGEIIPCSWGFHASERVIDALGFINQDSIITRVELSGTIIEHGHPVDKLAASERTILWRLDAPTTDRILREHARWSALQVAHLWEMPDVAREYLETGNEELRDAAGAAARAAAWDAAWDAAGAAARAAAWDAAGAAAWAAARAAAWDAAGAAAGAAARAAAWDAAWDAAGAAARAAAWDAAGAAAWAAARAAAWAAAWDAQNDKLTQLIEAARDAQNDKLTQLIEAAHEAQA